MDYNGDLRLLTHKIGELTEKMDKFVDKLDVNIESNNQRLRELEKQMAVIESQVVELSLKSNLYDFLNGAVALVAASIAAAIGWNK
jgi:chaperonin cofactor prefoldin